MGSKKLEASKQALFNCLVAMAMFGVAAVFPELAHATQDGALDSVAKGVQNDMKNAIQVLSVGCYAGGGLITAGAILQAKKLSENPGEAGGMGKVAGKGLAGACLLAAPSVMYQLQDGYFGITKAAPVQLNNITVQ